MKITWLGGETQFPIVWAGKQCCASCRGYKNQIYIPDSMLYDVNMPQYEPTGASATVHWNKQ